MLTAPGALPDEAGMTQEYELWPPAFLGFAVEEEDDDEEEEEEA